MNPKSRSVLLLILAGAGFLIFHGMRKSDPALPEPRATPAKDHKAVPPSPSVPAHQPAAPQPSQSTAGTSDQTAAALSEVSAEMQQKITARVTAAYKDELDAKAELGLLDEAE